MPLTIESPTTPVMMVSEKNTTATISVGPSCSAT